MPNKAGDYYVINLRQKNKGNKIKVERFTTSLYLVANRFNWFIILSYDVCSEPMKYIERYAIKSFASICYKYL